MPIQQLQNPWLDDNPPTSPSNLNIRCTLQYFFDTQRTCHKGCPWPYRLDCNDPRRIFFWEIRGDTTPPSDLVAHPGDIYINFSANPVEIYVWRPDAKFVLWPVKADGTAKLIPHPLLWHRVLWFKEQYGYNANLAGLSPFRLSYYHGPQLLRKLGRSIRFDISQYLRRLALESHNPGEIEGDSSKSLATPPRNIESGMGSQPTSNVGPSTSTSRTLQDHDSGELRRALQQEMEKVGEKRRKLDEERRKNKRMKIAICGLREELTRES